MKTRMMGGLLALLLVSADGAAFCPYPAGRNVIVGDQASDSACTFDDIQSALADSAYPGCATTIHVTRMHTWTSQQLSVSGRSVTLQGWGDGVTCSSLAPQCDVFSG